MPLCRYRGEWGNDKTLLSCLYSLPIYMKDQKWITKMKSILAYLDDDTSWSFANFEMAKTSKMDVCTKVYIETSLP